MLPDLVGGRYNNYALLSGVLSINILLSHSKAGINVLGVILRVAWDLNKMIYVPCIDSDQPRHSISKRDGHNDGQP